MVMYPLAWRLSCPFQISRSLVFHSSKFFRGSRIRLRPRLQPFHDPRHIFSPPHLLPVPQPPRLLHLLPANAPAPPPLHSRLLLTILTALTSISLSNSRASSVASHARRIGNPIYQARFGDRFRDPAGEVRGDRRAQGRYRRVGAM